MTTRDISTAIRSFFTDAEIAEIDKHQIELNRGTSRNAIDLAIAWEANIDKIDLDRALPRSDRSVWTEHDLAGALFTRDHLERAVSELPAVLQTRVRQAATTADERYRSFTEVDSGERMARIAEINLTDKAWWWFRVPVSGPISQDLKNYQ